MIHFHLYYEICFNFFLSHKNCLNWNCLKTQYLSGSSKQIASNKWTSKNIPFSINTAIDKTSFIRNSRLFVNHIHKLTFSFAFIWIRKTRKRKKNNEKFIQKRQLRSVVWKICCFLIVCLCIACHIHSLRAIQIRIRYKWNSFSSKNECNIFFFLICL